MLQSVLDTEITPELVPTGQDGTASSRPRTAIGPYALHDFALFHVLRYGYRARRRSRISRRTRGRTRMPAPGRPGSRRTTATRTTCPTVAKWLQVFLRRYFAFAQFKRSAIPNGPKVSAAGSLSPRGDWRAPSDGNARAWLAELRAALPELVED